MLNKIKSNSFMGWAAIFTVLFLAPNTYFVYHTFSVFQSPYREIASIGVALIIAGGIMIYTLRKKFMVAKYYTIFEVYISAYYYINTIGWDWGLIPALGFTLILPISVYYYSREFDKDGEIDYKDIIARNNKSFEELVMKNIGLENRLQNANNLIDQHQKASTDYIAQCEEKFSNINNECAHWVSEYERAVQGWTNDVSLRDERISELEYSIDYNSKILNSREETIKDMSVNSEYLRNELKKYDGVLIPKPKDNASKNEQVLSNELSDLIKPASNGRLLEYPESTLKTQAPRSRARNKGGQKSTE